MGWTTEGIKVQCQAEARGCLLILNNHTGYGPTHPSSQWVLVPFPRSTVVISHLKTLPTLCMRGDNAPVPYAHSLFHFRRGQVRISYTNS